MGMLEQGDFIVNNFSASYFGYGDKVKDVAFSLKEGEVMCLLGAEGSGKTTLLRALAGLEECRGQVTLGGKNWLDMPLKERDVCYTFGRDSLEGRKSVAENVVKPLVLRHTGEEEIKAALKRAAKLADIEDILAEKVKGLPPYYIAKIILARALIRKTNLLLLDEPLSELSFTQRERVFNRMCIAVRETGARAIYATERPYEAVCFPDKVGIMCEGRLVQCGSMSEIYKNPIHRAAADAFIRDITCIPSTAVYDGGWGVKMRGKRVVCPELINKIYDGREVLAAIRREDVSLGGDIKAKVIGVLDDGKGRFLRLGVQGGVIYCNGEAKIGQDVSITVKQAAFIFDPSSGFTISSRLSGTI